MKRFLRGWSVVALLLGLGSPLLAQEHAVPKNEIDIPHHLANARTLEYPCFHVPYSCELELPQWSPVHVGSVAIDLSPTRHSVLLVRLQHLFL